MKKSTMKQSKTKNIIVIIIVMLSLNFLSSCSVQQFCVNTPTIPFQNGGIVFGEKTRGKEFKMACDIFVIGVNVVNADTKKMAEDLKATSYTIETKNNFLSLIITGVTFGIVKYKVVKVIKR